MKRACLSRDDLVRADSGLATSPTKITPIQSDRDDLYGDHDKNTAQVSNILMPVSASKSYASSSTDSVYDANHYLSHSLVEDSAFSSSFTVPQQSQPNRVYQQSMYQIDCGGYMIRAEDYCLCLTNLTVGKSLAMLSQQLQSMLSMLWLLPEHRSGSEDGVVQCLLMRRIQDLDDLLMCVFQTHFSPYISYTLMWAVLTYNTHLDSRSGTHSSTYRDSAYMSPYEFTDQNTQASHQEQSLSSPLYTQAPRPLHFSSSDSHLRHLLDNIKHNKHAISAHLGESSGHRSPPEQIPPQTGNHQTHHVDGANCRGAKGTSGHDQQPMDSYLPSS